MRNHLKKYLAAILSVCMIFTAIPSTAFADVKMTSVQNQQVQYGIELSSDSINEDTVIDVNFCIKGTPYVNAEEPTDVILMIDKSGSMANDMTAMLAAAKNFVSSLDLSTHRIGLVAYDSSADCTDITDDEDVLLDAIDAISNNGGGTAIHTAIDAAVDLLKSKRTDAAAAIVLMTDGESNLQKALDAATTAKDLGYSFFTVALCKSEDSAANQNLKKMATSEADHYSVFSSSKLNSVYSNIASKIGNVNAKNVVITQDVNGFFEIVAGSYDSHIPQPTVNNNSMRWEMTQLVKGDVDLSYQIKPVDGISEGTYKHAFGSIYYTDYSGQRVKLDLPEIEITVTHKAPVINSITPNSVDYKGGDEVTITGENFRAGAILKVDGVSTPYTLVSSNEIKFTMPAHDVAKNVSVLVKNPNGKAASTKITVTASGIIESITPNTAEENKKQKVTIIGSGFKGTYKTLKVYVNGQKASISKVIDNEQIICTIPKLDAGVYDVVVQNSDGTTATLSQGYEVISATAAAVPQPTITSISPNTCDEDTAQNVYITGTNFKGTYKTLDVFIGTTEVTVATVSDTEIKIRAPKLAAGTYDVTVTNSDGTTVTYQDGYTVNAEVVDPCEITSISPNTCEENTAQNVYITGKNFEGTYKTLEVFIGTTEATVATVSDTEIKIRAPKLAAGTYDVTVTNSDGTTVTYQDGYTVNAEVVDPCEITSISPNTCEENTAQNVYITGKNFEGTYKTLEVFIGTTEATVATVSDTEIKIRAPKLAAGTYDVTVTNSDGTTVTLADAYTVTEVVVPTCEITGVSLTENSSDAATSITIDENVKVNAWIFGVEFSGTYKTLDVFIGTTEATVATVSDDTVIKIRTPKLAAGTYDITVENADGTTAVLKDAIVVS